MAIAGTDFMNTDFFFFQFLKMCLNRRQYMPFSTLKKVRDTDMKSSKVPSFLHIRKNFKSTNKVQNKLMIFTIALR